MQTQPFVYKVALPVPLRRLFDYLPPEDGSSISRGTRVRVSFGKKELIGVVFANGHSELPFQQLKPITAVCESEPLLPLELCDFIEKAARYYHHPIGEVAFTGTPLAFRQGKAVPALGDTPSPALQDINELVLNSHQSAALTAILESKNQFQPFLLQGITGSGKTEVYLQAAAAVLKEQKQVLILVPEISLTPQTQARFAERFGPAITAYHSRLSPKARWQAWWKIRSQQSQIIIGTRSAIFLPCTALGLIIIDEEHDPSFKQQEGFRYLARDLAVLRAKHHQCPIVLGSATPAFESLYNVTINKYRALSLPERATATLLPEILQLDVRHKKCEAGLSPQLLQHIEMHLQAKGQVLLFINRRGFAPTYLCYQCGWLAQCERCDARLTYHQKSQRLICHHCLHQRAAYLQCPSCESGELHPVGQGTERLESVLQAKFPTVNLARIDSDVTRKKGSLENLLEKAKSKEIEILIGTQILAKGHHFPHLTLVAIVDADSGLFSTDFRAIERMAQLLIQVAGRAGRVHQAGKVIIQTCQPDNPLLKEILRQDYSQLASMLLKERQQCHLPPFAHLALLRAQALRPQLAEAVLQEIKEQLTNLGLPATVSLWGPIPAPMIKRQGQFRFQLLFQAADRPSLHQLLSYSTKILENSKLAKRVRWSLDVDPLEML